MDLFLKAKAIRLISHNDRYLMAEEDRETISHSNDGSAKNAVWIVEFVHGKESIRLKSCFGTYLTASSTPFLPKVTGKKVVQTWPCQCDSATEWEPLRDGMQARLRSVYGHFLRPNGGSHPGGTPSHMIFLTGVKPGKSCCGMWRWWRNATTTTSCNHRGQDQGRFRDQYSMVIRRNRDSSTIKEMKVSQMSSVVGTRKHASLFDRVQQMLVGGV